MVETFKKNCRSDIHFLSDVKSHQPLERDSNKSYEINSFLNRTVIPS